MDYVDDDYDDIEQEYRLSPIDYDDQPRQVYSYRPGVQLYGARYAEEPKFLVQSSNDRGASICVYAWIQKCS